jgi:YHS domain-containing protein
MKRLILFVTAGILVAFAGYTVFAREHKEKMGEGMMWQKGEHEHPMPGCPMCAMVCKSMMEKALVATPDGGVVLMAGCKLIKFDKDLNKVKEVPIEIDAKEMQNKMCEMMKSCPMCHKMRMHEGMMHMKGSCDSNSPCIEQTTCPVTGKKINKNVSIEYKGKKVYFCCPACIEKFKADPDKYIDKLPQFKKQD